MTPLLQWQRIRLNPAVAKTWNRAGELTLDFDIQFSQQPKQVLEWLTLFDGSRSTQQLLESAAAMGIEPERATSHLQLLAQCGAIYEVDTIPAALGDSRAMYDARATGITFAKTGLEIAHDRQALRICVVGIGVLAYQLVTNLEAAGYLVGWSINTTVRITDDDVHLATMPATMIGRRWLELARKIINPDLVVVIDDAIDMTHIDLLYCESRILPVHVRTRHIEIGPLLHAEESVCAECVYEHQKNTRDDWPMMLTQLLHHRRAQPLVNSAATALTCAQIVMLIQNLASGQSTPLMSESLVLKDDDITWQSSQWTRHIATECRCGMRMVNAS